MLFKEGTPLYSYEIIRESGESVLFVNYLGASFVPSLVTSPEVMSRTIDILSEDSNVSRIVFVQQRNYSYDFSQVKYLLEISALYDFLVKNEKIASAEKLSSLGDYYEDAFAFLNYIIGELLKLDPIRAYRDLKAKLYEERAFFENGQNNLDYVRLIEKIVGFFDGLSFITRAKEFFEVYAIGERKIYSEFFRPDVMPNFTFTRMVAAIPAEAEIIDEYKISKGYDESLVTIYKMPDKIRLFYHLSPPEYNLNEDQHMLLNLARNVLIEHRPTKEEFNDPQRTRQVFFNIARDLIGDLASNKQVNLNYTELNRLATILVRHTIGFGVIEVLLEDEALQDIVINAPVSLSKIFVKHNEFDSCVTNLIPSFEDSQSWAAKFRVASGRPLDEANPILDTNLELPNASARIAIIQDPLSSGGLAYAIRRHRDKPWTLPLFIKNKMIDGLGAGILSFMVDGARTMLIAGTRSSGKCVDGNTLIQMGDGGVEKIKDLVGERKRDIDDGEIFSPRKESGVKSLKGMKISDEGISDVWKRTSPKKVIKIRTKSGKEIITTKEHPYFVYGGGIKNKRADSLVEKDLIVTPRSLKFDLKDQVINLTNNKDIVGEDDKFYYLKGRTNSQRISFPKMMSKDLAEFVGMIVGDGYLDKTKIEFHNQSFELRDRFKKILNIFNVNYREFESHTTSVVQVTSRALNRVLRDVFEIPFGKKSDKVVIPQIVFKSSNDVLARFIRGYFDCDGYVPLQKRDLEIVSASRMMGEHLKLALLRFGITSFVKIKKINGVNYYRIFIRGNFVNNFAKEIGSFHPFKKKRLDQLASMDFINNSNVDIIPDGNVIVRELRKKLRVSPSILRDITGKDYWAYENDKYRITRNWFSQFTSFYKKRYEDLSGLRDGVGMLKKFVDFDYVNYLDSIDRLRTILGLSYSSLAAEVGVSEAGMRKILNKKRIGNFDTLVRMFVLSKFLRDKHAEFSELSYSGFEVSYVPVLVEKGVVCYAEMGRECGIPESSLKYYCSGNSIPKARKEVINNYLIRLKVKMLFDIEKSFDLINGVSIVGESINFGLILSNLRNEFSISNEEFSERGISLTSVSNFFNGKYKSSVDVLRKLVGCVVDVYESCVNEEVLELVNEAERLANSDIFWDEVSSVEEIDKVDDYVYDLTVPGTHNFVANGVVAHNTSLLGSLLLEIMPSHRVILIEDTLELPANAMRKLDYDILSMKVRSALLAGESNEVGAAEGIRTSLRLGDSALIVGEIRSEEAKALYEAMRVGALANVVAGTIHGGSPYAVFDRVVNDLGVPVTSFKATDLIVVANPVKSSDGLHSARRVLSITEVRKHWEKDPLTEGGFVDLMKYDVDKDMLTPTDDLINGDSEIIKDIASNVKGWAGDWDAVWDNIILRQKMKEEVVEYAEKFAKPDLLEGEFTVKSNSVFHKISDEVSRDVGLPVSKEVFPKWKAWLEKEAAKYNL